MGRIMRHACLYLLPNPKATSETLMEFVFVVSSRYGEYSYMCYKQNSHGLCPGHRDLLEPDECVVRSAPFFPKIYEESEKHVFLVKLLSTQMYVSVAKR
jgi:hypothetical protein